MLKKASAWELLPSSILFAKSKFLRCRKVPTPGAKPLRSVSLSLVMITTAPNCRKSSPNRFATSRTTSFSSSPLAPLHPPSGPPCPGSITITRSATERAMVVIPSDGSGAKVYQITTPRQKKTTARAANHHALTHTTEIRTCTLPPLPASPVQAYADRGRA